MAESLTLEGKEYISSRRASELTGYTQDYIGQLARGGHIDAQRVAGLWYIFFESLQNYKTAADAYKPEPPQRRITSDPDSLIAFDGKDYVSAARAAKITGYHQDYVGQLARSGTVLARQVGNRWYVERDGIISHKRQKDALLAAVQSESVGLHRSVPQNDAVSPQDDGYGEEPHFTYSSDRGDLMPRMRSSDTPEDTNRGPETRERNPVTIAPTRLVPMHEIAPKKRHAFEKRKSGGIHGKTMSYAVYSLVGIAVCMVGLAGYTALQRIEGPARIASLNERRGTTTDMVASTGSVFDRIGNVIEGMVVRELVYKRK